MGKIVVSQNVSLDGVVQDPTGEEGFRRGGWFNETAAGDREAWAKVELEEALAAQALLLGRRSDEWFAARWNSRTGEWADRLRSLPKYVVSSTARDVQWGSGTVIRGDIANEVVRLKWEVTGDIVVYGSCRLVQLLVAHDLVDEWRLTVYPVVLNDGKRLFAGSPEQQRVRLVDSRVLGDGLAHLTYERVREAVA
ncbi:dihydrofolate reductase family protein [Acidothermaceae bacterium B102]|nr:dihydrofolate reductase family protein [Acidothermaceae bacterium B102]